MPIQHRKKLSIDNNNAVNIGRNLKMQSLDNQEPLLSSSVSPPRKHVMIIGGSFAGLCAARHLSNNKDLDITVVEPRKVFEYVPGACHLLAGSEAYQELITPIEECLPKKVKHIPGLFLGLKPDKLRAVIKCIPEDGDPDYISKDMIETLSSKNVVEIDYDAIIVCTGRGYATPIRASQEGRTFLGRINEIEKERKRIEEAKSILVIGGGLVGVELAADIASRSKKFLSKQQEIFLISRSQLLNTLPKAAGVYASNWFHKHNVSVSVSDDIIDTTDGIITTSKGITCKPDIILDCTGRESASSPKELKNTTFITTNSFVWPYDDKGFLLVDDYLQSSEYPHLQVFAAGDVIKHQNGVAFAYNASNFESYGIKTNLPIVRNAHLAESQAELVAHNVLEVLKNQSVDTMSTKLHRYPDNVFGTPLNPLLSCVSLGPRYSIVVFNDLVIGGVLLGIIGSFVKFLVERSKIAEVRNKVWGRAFWAFGHIVSNFIHGVMYQFKKKLLPGPMDTPQKARMLAFSP
jgi:NADH dehydrogenase FAD-containing subunit